MQASELTTTQATLEKERREARSYLENETGSLRSQLQSHAESIKIIVAEKAEYEATVKKMAAELSQKSGWSLIFLYIIMLSRNRNKSSIMNILIKICPCFIQAELAKYQESEGNQAQAKKKEDEIIVSKYKFQIFGVTLS